jgi:hypothetical protein
MKTSATTKQLARCASPSQVRPELACVAHVGNRLYATDSFKLARIDIDETTPEGATAYYDAKMLRTLPAGLDMAQSHKDLDGHYPEVDTMLEQQMKGAEELGSYYVQYLIDLLNVIKTKSNKVTLSRRKDDHAFLMLEGTGITGVLVPMLR